MHEGLVHSVGPVQDAASLPLVSSGNAPLPTKCRDAVVFFADVVSRVTAPAIGATQLALAEDPRHAPKRCRRCCRRIWLFGAVVETRSALAKYILSRYIRFVSNFMIRARSREE